MDLQLAIICLLTFVIHLIGTLAYSARIAGVRTRRIAISFALFNILMLVSRTSNSFQAPFLAKRIETGVSPHLLADFRWLLFSATAATLVGALLIPTFQRMFSRAVQEFQVHRSIPRLLLHGFMKGGVSQLRDSVSLPVKGNLSAWRGRRPISPGTLCLNVVAVALWTVGGFAALYAGHLDPRFRVTASTLSAIVNGVATILMFVFIDPQLSIMTDDVMEGRVSEPGFRQAIVWLVGGRCAGTVLAQFLLVPASLAIVHLAEKL